MLPRLYWFVRVFIALLFVYIYMQAHVLAYPGCTDSLANNYDAWATINDGSCIQCSVGQIFLAPSACCNDTNNDGTCDFNEVCNYPTGHGCTDNQACNFDPAATTDVGNCVVCTPWNTCVPDNIDPTRTSCCEDPDGNGICGRQNGWSTTIIPTTTTVIQGCTASNACNYNASATSNDNSCVFPKCNGWCAWDAEPEPFWDNCNVCDADLSNDDLCLVESPETSLDCNGVDGGPAMPWTTCNDWNAETIQDTFTNACSCEGFPIQIDCEDIPWGSALPWTTCDDGNSSTSNDTFTSSCSCIWIQQWTLDCNGILDGPAISGTSCNDGNATTTNDRFDGACNCVWQTQIVDCNNIVWWVALPGSVCNDNNPATSNDKYSASCSCIGQLEPLDCKNIPWWPAVPWTTCNDNDPATRNDTYNSKCNCIWIPQWTLDCKWIIDGPAMPWTSCDDGNSSTESDAYTSSCVCVWVTIEDQVVEEEIENEPDILWPPFDFPIVEWSIYVEFDDPIEQKEFEDLVNEYLINSIDQPFSNLDIDTFRIDFDPNIPYGDFAAALQKKFWNKIKFTEPIALIQIKLPLQGAWALLEQTMPDYLAQIGYDTLLNECWYLFTNQQKKIRVAIVDNGYAEHDDLWENVVYTYDAADKDKDVTIDETSEACAHGNIDAWLVWAISTNNIGIISAGYNPELVLIKATPDGRPCTDITAGIEWLAKAADEADIINISRWVDFDSKVLSKVIDRILDKWIVIVAAAGNFDTDKYFYPAAYDGVISVWAVDKNNNKAHFSNHGDWVDISAPWVDMLSTALENEYAKVSGTSQSSPLTAGWLAFLMSHGRWVEDLYKYVSPIDRSDMWRWIINPEMFCKQSCTLTYDTLDANQDGILDTLDTQIFTERFSNEYSRLWCEEKFSMDRCCPTWTQCDIDGNDIFDSSDMQFIEEIIAGSTYYEICGDGIDNNCDGVIDCKEHGVAPLVATTSSITDENKLYGWILIFMVVIIWGAIWIWKKTRFMQE